MGGAFAGIHPVVGGAAVVMVGAIGMAVGFLRHDPATVTAADQAGKEQNFVRRYTFADVSVEQALGFFEGIPVYDGLVGAFYPDPVFFRHSAALLDFIADGGVFSLNHVADVHFVSQDPPHGAVRPKTVAFFARGMAVAQPLAPFVGGGVGDAHGIELFRDAHDAAPMDEIFENHPHDGRGFLIDDQLMMIVRVLEITVGGKAPDKFTLLAVDVQRSPDIDRGGGGHGFVDHIGNTHGNELGGGIHIARRGIQTIVDGNEPHPVADKYIVEILPALGSISAEPGQILHDHTVDMACVDILHHPLEARAVKIGAAPAVIDVGVIDDNIRPELEMLLEDLPLVGNGVGLRLVSVIPGQSDVERRLPGAEGA